MTFAGVVSLFPSLLPQATTLPPAKRAMLPAPDAEIAMVALRGCIVQESLFRRNR